MVTYLGLEGIEMIVKKILADNTYTIMPKK